jgi:3-oxoacyl-[acyl-carrier-protein] synthase-3
MRWDRLFVSGVASWLPGTETTADAVSAGLLTAERREKSGFRSVTVASPGPEDAPPEMAVRAARSALKRAGTEPADLALVVHATLAFQGVDMWPPASYVADGVGARQTPSLEVKQRCNGAMAGLDLAAAYLTRGADGPRSALITTADRFATPQIDRWNSVDICLYGDGATALVLSTERGFARVLATANATDNSLEGIARGGMPFTPLAPGPETLVDLGKRTADHLAEGAPPDLVDRYVRVLVAARDLALADAGVPVEDLAWALIPASRRGTGHELHYLLDVPDERTSWAFGRTTGHLGAGDQFAALEHLVLTGRVDAGDKVLLYGGGAGYNCTTAVVEILEPPAW